MTITKYVSTLLLLLFASSSFPATTYYVRTDGGTPTQCSGLVTRLIAATSSIVAARSRISCICFRRTATATTLAASR
jgi:hypothetical protein